MISPKYRIVVCYNIGSQFFKGLKKINKKKNLKLFLQSYKWTSLVLNGYLRNTDHGANLNHFFLL